MIFPCGSEIGLEIHRSLKHSIHFNLVGANSVSDHGRFVYENYIQNVPFVDDPHFVQKLNQVIADYKIDLLFPTMDEVIARMGDLENEINCQIVGSPASTSSICLSKKKTTEFLSSFVKMPKIYDDLSAIKKYPVFLKPEIGYSSRNTKIAYSKEDVVNHLTDVPGCLVMEYLSGEEYTVDCFSSSNRSLLFSRARLRKRISNGISVSTIEADKDVTDELKKISIVINEKLQLRGAWFYQLKRSEDGILKVIEVAARLGGSSALFRAKGINFASLTLWDALGKDVEIIENNYEIELDRALDHKFKLHVDYKKVYIDFDDTLLLDNKINLDLVTFLFQCINENKELICITRHAEDIEQSLEKYRLNNIFQRVIHLKNGEPKSKFIEADSIFIDDSFAERKEVAKLNIPVFSPDMVLALIK